MSDGSWSSSVLHFLSNPRWRDAGQRYLMEYLQKYIYLSQKTNRNIQCLTKTKKMCVCVCNVYWCFCWHKQVHYVSTTPFNFNLSCKTTSPALFVVLVLLLSVWACAPPLKVVVFGLSLFPLLPCWAMGILLQVSMTIVLPAGYWDSYSDSRKRGYFLTRHEQLPALCCMVVCQGWGTGSRAGFVWSFVITSSSQSSAISSRPTSLSLSLFLTLSLVLLLWK